MAETPAPLIWDFWRDAGSTDGLGGVVDYYDCSAQDILLDSGISQSETFLENGHWEETEWQEPVIIDETGYSLLEIEHPAKGTWYGVAVLPGTIASPFNKFYFLRYQYIMDLGDIVESGSWTAQVDNPICQLNFELENIDEGITSDESSLFQIGAAVELYFCLGNSSEYPIGIAYIDSIDHDILGETVSVSGRNKTGFILNDETFDQDVSTTGLGSDLAEWIFQYFGIQDYEIEETDPLPEQVIFDWKANTTGLTALKDLEQLYSSVYPVGIMWSFEELPNGKMVMGRDEFRYRYLPRTYYTFEGNREVFSRKIGKSIDIAYSHVYAVGKDANGDDLDPVTAEVQHRETWNVGPHRTYFAPEIENITQHQLLSYASQYAAMLRDVGVKETFLSPLRPNLLVGDTANIYYDEDSSHHEDIGVITEVKHSFGKKGFTTEFTLESGGFRSYVAPWVIARTLTTNGDTRRKRLLDFFKDRN